ncbi:lasso peptide isopeptide bond-forming cyclase [Streptomyces sp. NPDC093591]|uniref:lasso peptide isopeptide bond-forming cyclase n=1 Tax=Streptomyces sp. NPDC093591 TaxID=3366044 RepID=UPI0038011B92
MVDLPDAGQGPDWFVVLPDSASAARVGAALRGRRVREISHPSGRPWLLGRWSDDAVTVGEAGRVKLAVVGEHTVTADRLATAADRTGTVAALDELARGMVGSSHLVASVTGRVRVQGSVTGMRRVFHARIGDAAVAADRADVLAALLDAEVDEQQLAARLLNPCAPHPLGGEPVWRGVGAVEVGHYVALDAEGRARTVAWWVPPEPVVPMAEGAPALREALSAAVEARIQGRDVVSCDLGGLDSTSLCALAARGRAQVIAYTADGLDPMCADVTWARRTVAALRGVDHHIIAGDRMPMVYEGVQDIDDRFDEPCPAVMHPSRCLIVPGLAAARGSQLHLTGFGGDELLAGSPAHLHTLMRTHPRTAWRSARGFAAQRPWSYRETLRQLWDNGSYRAWFAGIGDRLTAVPPPLETPALDWGTPPRMPPWATPNAVEAVRELLRTAARTAEPLAERRGQHTELEAMGSNSRMLRQLGQMVARATGVPLAAPYYDDRVIEAGMAVRPQDRITPWRYKPLIVEAMRGIVPDESLTRRTKDEGSHEAEVGMRERRAELLALCEDSRLAGLGLIDANVMREMCSRPLPPTLPFDAVYQTVVCEMWLRALETTAATAPG